MSSIPSQILEDGLSAVRMSQAEIKHKMANDSDKTNEGSFLRPKPNGANDQMEIRRAKKYAAQVQEKYKVERDKRIRPDGNDQFVKLHNSDKLKHFTHDPWLPADGSVPGIYLTQDEPIHFKFIIKGAGYGGLLYAARLVEAGFDPKDMAFVDYAGGFGGTWYWNRYCGVMCDIAASVYMPLLEETKYMPKHKYAYGQELREHAERIARQYGFGQQGIFRATVDEITWNDEKSIWEVAVTQEQGPKQGVDAHVVKNIMSGDFVISMSGILNYPKLPRVEGIESFAGHQFHTSRWDYQYTGGSQEEPDLMKLRNKVVGIVGTGPTSIQVFPEVAKWAKHVYIFQRTPSSVDGRGQCVTNPVEWHKICSKPGWQRNLMDNLAAHLADDPEKPKVNLVNDGWSNMPSYKALVGGPNAVDGTKPDTIAEHLTKLHMLDFGRQERLRARVEDIVKDKDTARQLKAWYPGWCKRPCFHDDYLPTFNRPNATLVDTEGRGLNGVSRDGVVAAGKEYKVDLLIWATGYSLSTGSPGERGGMKVSGRNGVLMTDKWSDLETYHGVTMRDFPNFFFPLTQCGITGSATHMYYATADHTAFLIKEAERRHPGRKVLIEPTEEAARGWAMRIMAGAAAFAGLSGCTPSYLNAEGEVEKIRQAPLDVQMKAAKRSPWSQGIRDYERILREWREKGDFEGMDITVL